MRTAIAGSHVGVEVRVGDRTLDTFPRVLLCVCDQPEERSVLRRKAGKRQWPSNLCQVTVDVTGAAEALSA